MNWNLVLIYLLYCASNLHTHGLHQLMNSSIDITIIKYVTLWKGTIHFSQKKSNRVHHKTFTFMNEKAFCINVVPKKGRLWKEWIKAANNSRWSTFKYALLSLEEREALCSFVLITTTIKVQVFYMHTTGAVVVLLLVAYNVSINPYC